ncbi:tyrosine-type recombinase/integrase [Nocardia sp. NPDC057227]|uniref:tyrosine-type recombinase/integrase n=1 Tax=Nocardia sp. NPDC057227 TaxID=3346056 RepID=UPI0036360619
MSGPDKDPAAPGDVAHLEAVDSLLIAKAYSTASRRLRLSQGRWLSRQSVDYGGLSGVGRPRLIELQGDPALTPAGRRNRRNGMVCVISALHELGLRPDNPAAGLPRVRCPFGTPDPIDDPALYTTLGDETKDSRARRCVRIMAETGLRRHEAAKLRREDIRGYPGRYELRVIGKGGVERVIPIGDELADFIRDGQETGYVFPGRIDGHLSAQYLGKLVADALPPGRTAHKIRHRYASTAYAATKDLRAVQQLLGHASVRTTQIYTAVPDDAVRAAAMSTRLEVPQG